MTPMETNITSVSYIMTALYRLGLKPTEDRQRNYKITLDNKNGKTITIDVNGSLESNDPPLEDEFLVNDNHVYIFVFFQGEIANLKFLPEVYIIPSTELEPFVIRSTRKTISYSKLKEQEQKYINNWKVFT